MAGIPTKNTSKSSTMNANTPPRTMRAVVTRFLRAPVVASLPVPQPKATEMLVKVEAAALNPTDYKSMKFATNGYVVGCDLAGTVVSAPASSKFVPGDRVGAIVHGCNSTATGAFAEYAVCDPALAWKIPDGTTVEEAAGMGVGWCSAVLAVVQKLLPWAKDHGVPADSPLLIYSASTTVGLQSTQIMHLLCPTRPIIALASPAHHTLLHSLGATHCFAYSDPDLDARIEQLELPPIQLAVDGYATGDSTRRCERLMGGDAGRIVRVHHPQGKAKEGVEVDWMLTYTVIGKPFRFFLFSFPAKPEDHALASEWMNRLTTLLPEKKVQVVPHRIIEGGLAGVVEGLRQLKEGEVKGQKLVVRVS